MFLYRNVHFKIGSTYELAPDQSVTSFCRRNSPWPSQFLDKSFITPVTSQVYLSATAMTSSHSSQSIHRESSEPTLSKLLDQPGAEPQNFHRRSFSGHDTKADFNNVMTKSRSLTQSSFTIITNPLSASGQVLGLVIGQVRLG